MKRIWMFILIFVFMFACKQEMQESRAVVSGQFTGAGGEMASLKELKPQRIIPVDSVMTDNQGSFKLELLPEETGFYLLSVADREPVSLVIGAGDSIKLVLGTADIYRHYEVDGNKSSRMLMKYHHKTGETKQVLDSLRNVLFKKQGEPDFAEIKPGIDATLESALNRHRDHTEQIIRDNPAEVASLLLLNQAIAGQPVFKPEEDAELYFLIEDSLSAKYPVNSHVKAHIRRMNRIREIRLAEQEAETRVGIGKKIPQIQLPGIQGKPLSVSSLQGNPVIVCFWASWSPESRADLQMLKQLYNRYQDSGLEVYAVSVDHNPEIWKAAVKTEELSWVNVNDEAGMRGPTAKLFNLGGELPYYFLIDESGTIIEKSGSFSKLEKSVKDFVNPGPVH